MSEANSAAGAPQIGEAAQTGSATTYPTYLVAFLEDGEPVMAETFPTMDPGRAVKIMAGPGNPFYVYDKATIGFDWWNGLVVDDWSEAATCSSDITSNNTSIAAQIASPSSKVHAP